MTLNWGGWIFSSVVLLLLFFLSMILKDPVRLSITGKRAKDIAVTMAKVEGSAPDTLRPIVEFVTSTGEHASATSRELVGWSLSHLGDKVTVLYNPSNPSDAHLVMLNEYRGVGFILGFIAIIILMWTTAIVSSGSPHLMIPSICYPCLLPTFAEPCSFPHSLHFVFSDPSVRDRYLLDISINNQPAHQRYQASRPRHMFRME